MRKTGKDLTQTVGRSLHAPPMACDPDLPGESVVPLALASAFPSPKHHHGDGSPAGRAQQGRERVHKAASHDDLSLGCSSFSFKEHPHTWRELDFLLRIRLSSRLKTIFMSCGCLHANLSFRGCVPSQTPTEAYQDSLPSFG